MKFSVSGRMMSHLGEALISDETIALNELIKNTYDADANNAFVNINSRYMSSDNTEEIGQIVITDDGIGMTRDDIEKGFLKLGTDFKLNDKKISPKYNRLSQGNKGIGRLSLHRLGRFVQIITCYEGTEDCYTFAIDWNEFDKSDNLTEVDIDVKKDSELYQKYFGSKIKKKHGTILIITDLKNKDLWRNGETKLSLEKELLSLINPYVEDNKKFQIIFDIDGDILNSNTYSIDKLRGFSDITAKINFLGKSFQGENNDYIPQELFITIQRSEEYINWRLESLEKKMRKNGFKILKNRNEIMEIFKNKADYIFTDKINIDLKNIINEFPFLKFDYKEKTPIGDFSGEIFVYNSLNKHSEEDRKFLEQAIGVQLFRNGFKVSPYGRENDWFNFTKYSQTISNNSYKLHTTAGYINIDGEYNLATLKELSNREGIVQDAYGENFLTIIKNIVGRLLVQKDIEFRNILDIPIKNISKLKYKNDGAKLDVINEILFVKEADSPEIIAQEIEQYLGNDKKGMTNNDIKNITNSELIERSYQMVNSEIAQRNLDYEAMKSKENEIKKFTYSLGTMQITEFLAHEINEKSTKIRDYALKTLGYKEINLDTLKKIHILQENILNCTNYIARHAAILDRNSYAKKRKYSTENIKSIITNTFLDSPLLDIEEDKIELIVIGESFTLNIIPENLTVALENLVINSTYWLSKYKVMNPAIIFTLIGKKTLHIADNGRGIHKEIENTLFNAFETLKPDGEGRGIGLVIVKKLLEEMGANIQLLDERNKFGNKYKFEITFKEKEHAGFNKI